MDFPIDKDITLTNENEDHEIFDIFNNLAMNCNGIESSPDSFPNSGSLPGGLEDEPFLSNCEVCKQALSEPVVLSCLHVFDKSCLKQFQINFNSNFPSTRCPTCKEHSEPWEQLRVLKSLIQEVECEPNEENTVAKCTLCTESGDGVSKCFECSAVLCETCVDTHKRMKMFSRHNVIELTVEEKVNFMKLIKSIEDTKPINCQKHNSRKLDLFCLQCYAPICEDCASSDHALHGVESFEETRATLRGSISAHLQKIRQWRVTTSARNERLHSILADIGVVRDHNKGHIEEAYKDWMSALNEAKELFIQKNREFNGSLENVVQQHITETDKIQNYLEYVHSFSQLCLTKMTPMEFLFTAKSMMVGLNSASALSEKVNITNVDNLQNGARFNDDRCMIKKTIVQHFGSFPVHDFAHTNSGSSSALNNMGVYNKNGRDEQIFDGVGDGAVPGLFEPNHTGGIGPSGSNQSFSPSGVGTPAENISSFDFPLTLHSLPENYPMMNNNNAGVLGHGNMRQIPDGNAIRGGGMYVQRMNGGVRSGSPDRATPSRISNDDGFFGVYNNEGTLSRPIAKPGSSSSMGYNPNPNPPFPNRQGRCSTMSVKTRWGSMGASADQMNAPHGFCLGFKEEIVVADTNNHRILIFDKSGSFLSSFGVAGREEGQLWFPRKVAIMGHTGKYVVCDRGTERSRMQIFTASGHFIRKITIRYIDIVAGVTLNSAGDIVAVDSVSPSVFVIKETGDLYYWFDCSEFMREPSDIVYNSGHYYICDFKGHCVSVFDESGVHKLRIGSDSITNFPNGIDVSDHGDVLVGDSHGNRLHVAVFDPHGNIRGEFECPNVKVSRCCGLKITSEGLLVTLAKNNNQVLVIDTLYIN